MIKRHIIAIATCVLLTPLVSLAAPIELGSPFRDNAILQREMNLPAWGWSNPTFGPATLRAFQQVIVE